MYQQTLGCTPEQCGIVSSSTNLLSVFMASFILSLITVFIVQTIKLFLKKGVTLKSLLISFLISQVFIIIGLLLVLTILGIKINFITPKTPAKKETYSPKYTETKESTVINTSDLPEINFRWDTAYNKIRYKVPSALVRRSPEDDKPDTITYGLGIKNDFTLRHGDLSFKEGRINKFKSEKDVAKKIVIIDGKKYETYDISPKLVGDYFIPGFRDWYVEFGNEIFVFSQGDDGYESFDKSFSIIVSSVELINN